MVFSLTDTLRELHEKSNVVTSPAVETDFYFVFKNQTPYLNKHPEEGKISK